MDTLISESPSSLVQAWFKYRSPTHVVKRDGRTVAFDSRHIGAALLRAGRSAGEFGESEAQLLEQRVMKVLRHRFSGLTPNVEQVQDIVEQTLVDADYLRTLRSYVAYRGLRERLCDLQRTTGKPCALEELPAAEATQHFARVADDRRRLADARYAATKLPTGDANSSATPGSEVRQQDPS